MSKNNSKKINSTVIGVIVAIVVLGGIIWIAQPGSDNKVASSSGRSNGVLVVEGENSYDFGSVSMAAGKVKNAFKIKNTGAEAVTISKMYTSCMCTTAVLEVGKKKLGPFGMPGHGAVPSINQVVGPSEEALVEVIFDPAAHGPAGVGSIQRVVTIENNAGEPIELQFTAMVTP